MSEKKSNTGIWALIFKFGSKLLSICLKGSKFILAVGAYASYSYMFGWKFAIAIMIMLFVHESGHVCAMRKRGIPTKGFYFIPFIGGAAIPDRAFSSRGEEFYVAIMGPIWGFLLSFFVMILYYLTLDPLFAVISSWMALVNLFNLLPINPLDGGRMLKSILFSVNSKLGIIFLYIGMVLMCFMMCYYKIYFFSILLIISGIELYMDRKKHINLLYDVSIKEKKFNLSIKTEDEVNILPTIPKNKILYHIFYYIIIVMVLYSIMYLMKDIPGSDIAKKLIYG